MKQPRKRARAVQLQETELVPITDPEQQAALDRVLKNGKITAEDRRLLDEGRTASTKQRRKR